jgi:hypothetical protein
MRPLAIAALILAVAGTAAAQDSILAGSDAADAPAARWSWFGDFLLRQEHTDGLPNNRDALDRTRARLRAGGEYAAMPTLSFGAAIELGQGSDRNRDNRINNDNERSNAIGLDRLFLHWQPGEHTRVLVGKTPLPFELTPLVWDADLRPAGASVVQAFPVGDFDRIEIGAGVFRGQHLYDDDSRIAAVQAAWRWRDGAPTGASVLLTYLDFSHLEQLTSQGLARTNRRVPGTNRLVSDYRLVDLQLVGRTQVGSWPLEARLDLVRNLGADDQRDGARFSLVLGDRRRAGGWEFGYSNQRIQRDAVMAAFNEDDWWFHSFTHGYMPWVGYGFDDNWSLRVAGFRELRDGLGEHTRRLVVDLESRW